MRVHVARIATLLLIASAVLTATVLSACDSAGAEETPPSSQGLSATVRVMSPEAEQTVDYEGTGLFGVGERLRPEAPLPSELRGFFLSSFALNGEQKQFRFSRPSDERPAEGTYAIGEEGFRVSFEQVQGEEWQVFSAGSGEITITASSENRLEGQFTLEGALAQVCERIGQGGRRCTLGGESSGGAFEPVQVEASGSFKAVPRGERLP